VHKGFRHILVFSWEESEQSKGFLRDGGEIKVIIRKLYECSSFPSTVKYLQNA